MKKLILLAVLGLMAACASESKYVAVLTSWVGAPESALIRSWGPPQQAYSTGDSKFLVYNRSASVVIPGASPTYQTTFIGNTAYTTSYGGTPATQLDYSCQTTFEVQNGKIVDYSYVGNNCRAK